MANLFLNYVNEKLIYQNTTEDGSRQFANVSVPVKNSKSGYGSFAVNLGQVLDITKKDGSVVEGYKNILLGNANKIRKVSIKKGKKYVIVEMTNQEIVNIVIENRKAYRANTAKA